MIVVDVREYLRPVDVNTLPKNRGRKASTFYPDLVEAFMSSDEAKEYGLVDEVVQSRKQIPGLGETFPPQAVVCEQVLDPALGPLVPAASDRPGTYRYPGQKASVLVLGDSFSRIYQFPEPQSLGELPPNPTAGRTEDEAERKDKRDSDARSRHGPRPVRLTVSTTRRMTR